MFWLYFPISFTFRGFRHFLTGRCCIWTPSYKLAKLVREQVSLICIITLASQVIELGNSAKLLEALDHLAADEELAKQYGTQAQIRQANECFTGTIHADNYFKVYKEVF